MKNCAIRLVFPALILTVAAWGWKETQRELAVRVMRAAPDGVQIVGSETLACAVTVALPDDEPNEGLRLQLAATVASMKARAELALYLVGEYSSQVANESKSHSAVGGSIRSAAVSQVIESSARARFADGERISFERPDEKTIRVIYAWGLPRGAEEFHDPDLKAAVKAIAERALESPEFPSPEIRVVRLPDQREALLVVVKVIAPTPVPLETPCVHPSGESLEQSRNGKPYACGSHRRKVVETKVDATVLAWISGGDVSCSRQLRRVSLKTVERIGEGAQAIEKVIKATSRSQASTVSTEFKGKLGPEWYQSRIKESRVTAEAAVCAVLIPLQDSTERAEPAR